MKISMIPNKIVKLIHASKGDTSLRKWAFEPYDNNGAINVSNIKDQLVYKTENGGTEQLLPVNTSTPTTSYFDGTINYGTDTDVEFAYKQSSYTGQARIKSIKGNTLVWNQLIRNGNFADTSNWSAESGVTFSVSNNIATISSTTANNGIRQSFLKPLIANHKYIVKAEFNVPLECRCVVGTAGNQDVQIEKLVSTPNSWTEVSGIGTSLVATTAFYCFVRGTTYENVKIRNVMCFDLTAMGLDTLTVDQFKSLFPLNYYAYDSGSLLNFNGTGIKTENKDQTDEYTLSLPISTYFPTGMKDVSDNTNGGKIYDELSDKAITRVGSITLDGTQTQSRTYNRTNGDIIMYYENQGWKPNTSNTTMPNISSNIGVDTPNHQFSSDTTSVTITTTNGGELALVIAGKTTASDVNTYLASNPVYVNYELATYTETDIQNASLVCKNIEVPCYLSNGNLVCDATEDLTSESGFFDAKLKIKDSSSVAYSSKFKLHVEDL